MEYEPPVPSETYLQLRERILMLKPQELNLAPSDAIPHVWGVLMETGYEVGTASLIILADGTTSLYYSTGGGMLGSADYSPIAEASKVMVVQAETVLDNMSPATDIILPSIGEVRFSILTFSGVVTATASESSLASGKHPLSRLYASGHQVLHLLRVLKDKSRS